MTVTENDEIRELNKKYRNIDAPTDVLSFPTDKPTAKDGGNVILGDILISKNYLKKESDLEELFAHGLLHLIGYDHEKNKREWERVMKQIREKLPPKSSQNNTEKFL